jgi:hypothetical protein
MADASVLLGQLAEEFTAAVRAGNLPEVEDYTGAGRDSPLPLAASRGRSREAASGKGETPGDLGSRRFGGDLGT